jgi:Xaa-Pro aminopeptidase
MNVSPNHDAHTGVNAMALSVRTAATTERAIMSYLKTSLALALTATLVLLSGAPALAQTPSPPVYPMRETAPVRPELPPILPLRDRAAVIDRILEERLDTIIPQIMREEGVSLWVLMAREYFEEPVVESMLDARSMAARRRTILVFFDPGEGQPIERLTVSRYGLAGLFEPSWDPEAEPDQWQAVADIITARNPANIAINFSELTAFGDGMTLSQHRLLMNALPAEYHARIVSGETLAIRWLETRTPSEMEIYPGVVRIAHALIGRALSNAVITPGVTTADDVVWWYREELSRLGLTPWFHPSIGIQREGADAMLRGDTVIEPGDLVWTDFGITYLRLSTDTQHLAYVLKPGETEAPEGLRQGLAASNRVQDILISHFETGLSGNEVLARARAQAIAEGLDPSIYTHPIGTHGHGAGPAIGFWDNQNPDPRGAGAINPNTAWAIELTSYSAVPEWGGQRVDFRTEEDAFFDGQTVRFLDGRQTELTLIQSPE